MDLDLEYIRDKLMSASSRVQAVMEITKTPGLSLGVMYHGEVLLSQGYGYAVLENQVKATDQTIYPIASLTKQFTSAACGLLVSQGRLKWDVPISEYLPELKLKCPKSSSLSCHASLTDILAHAVGIPDYQTLYLGVDGTIHFKDGDDHLFDILNQLPAQVTDFRKVWMYNALTYSLLGQIILQVSGMSYAEFIQHQLCRPIGMLDTRIMDMNKDTDENELSLDRHALPYVIKPDGSPCRIPFAEYGHGTPFAASCGIQSSVSDLLIWARAIVHSFTQFENKPAILKEMAHILAPHCPLSPTLAYGLGWFISDQPLINQTVWSRNCDESSFDLFSDSKLSSCPPPKNKTFYHSGSMNGFSSSIHVFPDTCDAVVVLTNSSGHDDATDWVSRIFTTIIATGIIPNIEESAAEHVADTLKLWPQINRDWAAGRSEIPQKLLLAQRPVKDLIGNFCNKETGMVICIFAVEAEILQNGGRGGVEKPPLLISFHADHLHSIQLSHYIAHTYTFFPSHDDYYVRCMQLFTQYKQFLLHFHFESAEQAAGLWWQYNEEEDAMWFPRDSINC